jgi:hypothetical protein
VPVDDEAIVQPNVRILDPARRRRRTGSIRGGGFLTGPGARTVGGGGGAAAEVSVHPLEDGMPPLRSGRLPPCGRPLGPTRETTSRSYGARPGQTRGAAALLGTSRASLGGPDRPILPARQWRIPALVSALQTPISALQTPRLRTSNAHLRTSNLRPVDLAARPARPAPSRPVPPRRRISIRGTLPARARPTDTTGAADGTLAP